ncbi:hypothetical protein [Methylocucumis oryzae]|uniref:Lipoprotein n=1 Tax=Methylocucumis oryzae TaxID=1632867 RepID=A0A0F3IM13_9GAMM|nr:hypothetical protein [Methylocucumis oryzae]KJV07776.1 hypothetical protein VZ94_02305 [Methylocucumis oryzae]
MKIFRFPLISLVVLFNACFAEEQPWPEPEHIDNNKIKAVITKYAETLGCSIWFNPQNIVPHLLNDERLYVGLFSVDLGCSGGNLMNRPVFVAVKPGAYDQYFIDYQYSSPAQTSDKFPQHTTEIFFQTKCYLV